MAKRILKLELHDFTTRALAELTAAETGILMRLLAADAEHDGIPADVGALCAIARVTRERWDRGLCKKMGTFFTMRGDKVCSNIESGARAKLVDEKEKSLSTQVIEYWKTEFLKRNGAYPVNPTAVWSRPGPSICTPPIGFGRSSTMTFRCRGAASSRT